MRSWWIKHPRSKKPDAMLTIAMYACFVVFFKVLFNGVTFTLGEAIVNLGTVEAALVAAVLTPTLGAYVGRKFKDSPDKSKEE